MHAIATMADRLRGEPGARGLVTANGGFTTKHAAGVYSTVPPADGFQWTSPQEAVDALPRRELVEHYEGPATIETYTVMHDRDGQPENAPAACLTADGRRLWVTSTDDATMDALLGDRLIGSPVDCRADAGFSLS
jgi:acetyl-CoA C-acetyltransferase